MVQASDDRSESVSNFHCLVREPVENVVTVLEDLDLDGSSDLVAQSLALDLETIKSHML